MTARSTPIVQVLIAAQRHFQMLHQARCGKEANREQAKSAVNRLRPPVNFQRKPIVTKALMIWRPDALTRTLTRLDQISFDVRTRLPSFQLWSLPPCWP